MKKLIGLLLFFSMLHARDVEETFLQANNCYKQKDFSGARTLYEKINKKGVATWYNLGNTQYELGESVQALVCWRNAQRHVYAEHDLEDIAYNIGVVEGELGKATPPHGWLYDFLARLIALRSLFAFQLLFLACWYALFVFVMRSKRSRMHTTAMVLLLLVNGVSGSVLFMKYRTHTQKKAIILAANTPLFIGPNDQYHKVGVLSRADEVSIQDEHEEWCKVCCKDTVGWVQRGALATV